MFLSFFLYISNRFLTVLFLFNFKNFIQKNKAHMCYTNHPKCIRELHERKGESDAKLMPQIVNLDTLFTPIFWNPHLQSKTLFKVQIVICLTNTICLRPQILDFCNFLCEIYYCRFSFVCYGGISTSRYFKSEYRVQQ